MSKQSDLLPFDLAAYDAVEGSDSEAKTAADALRIAADYLRRREPMPPVLADYLADAFEVATMKPEAYQVEALALELGLMALNRRRASVRPWVVALFVDDEASGNTERQRILAAMDRFGVAETTARRFLKEGRAILTEVSKLKGNGEAE